MTDANNAKMSVKYPKNVRMIPMHFADLVSKIKEMPNSDNKQRALNNLEVAGPYITAMMEEYNAAMIEMQHNLEAARQAAITGRPIKA